MSFRPFGQAQGKLREKSFLDPSYSLGMMGMGSSPLRLGAFAGDNSAFGCGCSPTGEPLFPSEVWEKACTTMAQSFRGLRKFCKSRKFSDSDIPRAKSPRRQDAKVRKFFGCLLCAFASLRRAQASLREIFRFLWLRLCRAGIFVVIEMTLIVLGYLTEA